MKTPVIIPAFNSEREIARVLGALPRSSTEPFVAVNGSTDKTAEIARGFGVTVYDIEAKGKLPAVQYALRELGERALEPMLLLDSDTTPVWPQQWLKRMTAPLLDTDRPTYVSGPAWFTKRPGGSGFEATVYSVGRLADALGRKPRDVKKGKAAYYGPNQSFVLHNEETLERVLALPHYWPKEDVAFASAVVNDGEGIMHSLLDYRAAVSTQASVTFPHLTDWVKKPVSEIDAHITDQYRASAADGSIPYEIDKN